MFWGGLVGGRLGGFVFDFGEGVLDKFGKGEGGLFPGVEDAKGNGFFLFFFFADNENAGNFGEFGVANSFAKRFVGFVKLGTNSGEGNLFKNFLGIRGEFFGDGEDADLGRGKPEGKFAGIVLDEDAYHAFEGAENGSVDHDGMLFFAVGVDVV